MAPIMTPDDHQRDRRKGKQLSWKEAKISLAHAQDNLDMHYGGTLKGGVDEAGTRWFDCACRAGFGRGSQVHAVGDGTRWIVDQVDQRFGPQGRYLIDFYPICEYLSEASGAIEAALAATAGREAATAWMDQQKTFEEATCLSAGRRLPNNQRTTNTSCPCSVELWETQQTMQYNDFQQR